MTTTSPTTESDVAAFVLKARAAKTPMRIVGGGTRLGIGCPVGAGLTLSTAKLSGVTLYEPSEMVIGALAGTPVAAIEKILAAKGQMLPFEPIDHRAILGTSGTPTIGAVAAGNFSGPRRIMAGAARDSLIGVKFVNGRGEIVKSGGRVMKNVTGLDLVKLQSGAFGTLGILTEVIFKVLPVPETAATLLLTGLDDSRAVEALSLGLITPFEVTGAAHLPGLGDTRARTLLRIEGFDASVRYRAEALRKALHLVASVEILDATETASLWRDVRDAVSMADPQQNALWRLSLKPSDGPEVVSVIARDLAIHRRLYDWGGGLVWLVVDSAGDAGAAVIRKAVAGTGGHATLIRAPDPVRASVGAFQPEVPALAKLAAGIRTSVDPDGLFNPGLMQARSQ